MLKRVISLIMSMLIIVVAFSACSEAPDKVSSTASTTDSSQNESSTDESDVTSASDLVNQEIDNTSGFEFTETNAAEEETVIDDDGSPNAEKYANSKRIELYKDGKFDYNLIISEYAETEIETIAKKMLRVVNANSDTKKALIKDSYKAAQSGNRIFIGNTDNELTKEVDKLLYGDGGMYDDYIIVVKKGNIFVYSRSSKGMEDAVEFFNETFLSDESENNIPENYQFIYRNRVKTNMSIGGVDVSQYIIVTEKYPSWLLTAGAQEIIDAVKEKTGFEIPLVKTNDELSFKNKIVIKVEGNDTNAYSLKIDGGDVVVSGGHIYSVNVALSRFAANISNVPNDKTFNIPKTFKFTGKYTSETVGTSAYQLVYSDEFNTNTLDGNYWTTTNSAYTDSHGAGGGRYSFNVELNDGLLHLKTSAEEKEDGWYYYGSAVNSTFKYQFGYAEIRAKINDSPSAIFPAFWMFTSQTLEKNFHPEIDVFEFFGSPYELEPQIHSWWSTGQVPNGQLVESSSLIAAGHHQMIPDAGYKLPGNESFANDYHTYGCEWTPEYIKFTCDGYVHYTVDIRSDLKDSYGTPLNKYMQFLNSDVYVSFWSNIAQGQWCVPDSNTNFFTSFSIDYYHLYQQSGVGSFTPKS